MDADEVWVDEGHVADGAALVDHLLRGGPRPRAVLVGHHLDDEATATGIRISRTNVALPDPGFLISVDRNPIPDWKCQEGEGLLSFVRYRFNKTRFADTYCDRSGPAAGLGHWPGAWSLIPERFDLKGASLVRIFVKFLFSYVCICL